MIADPVVVVTVSAAPHIRRVVHEACQPHLSSRVQMIELDFQPDDDPIRD